MGPRGGGSFQGKKNRLLPPGIEPRISVPWPSHYTDYAVPAPIEKYRLIVNWYYSCEKKIYLKIRFKKGKIYI